jgi:hypothetical protein
MSEDRRLLDALTAELTALGFLVFSASDFEELADLVRSGLDRRFVLVSFGDQVASGEEVRDALSERLPGWSIRSDDDAERAERPQLRQLPN